MLYTFDSVNKILSWDYLYGATFKYFYFLFESSNFWRFSYLNSFNLQLLFAVSVYLCLDAHL